MNHSVLSDDVDARIDALEQEVERLKKEVARLTARVIELLTENTRLTDDRDAANAEVERVRLSLQRQVGP